MGSGAAHLSVTNQDAQPRVDVASVVAEIEAEVARRRAAGEYPEDLIRRLAVEFHDVAEAQPSPEEVAQIETVRPMVSSRRLLGPAVIFAKKVVRRAVAWYVRPLAEDQSRFNFAILQELRQLGDRMDGLGSSWVRPAGSPPREAGTPAYDLTGERLALLRELLRILPAGPVLLLWWADDALLRGLVARGLPVEAVTRDAAMAAAARASGVRVHETDPLLFLRDCGPTLGAILAPGLLPVLTPTEMLQLVPLATAALRDGGVFVTDAPDVSSEGLPADPALIDAGYQRWVSRETTTLLCESAGLHEVRTLPVGTTPWYAVTACRRP